jgi:hypothetical protein
LRRFFQDNIGELARLFDANQMRQRRHPMPSLLHGGRLDGEADLPGNWVKRAVKIAFYGNFLRLRISGIVHAFLQGKFSPFAGNVFDGAVGLVSVHDGLPCKN